MRICCHPNNEKGIALIMVMLVIVTLAVMAGKFAYQMKVETKLARNANYEADLEWLGRSGVELAKYVLGQQLNIPAQNYTALNQKWAGGLGTTNELLSDISLVDVPLGLGSFTVEISDTERKVNINIVDQEILERAFELVGTELEDSSVVVDSILDWRDPDDDPRISGTESTEYQLMEPPYYAKNGPLDHLSELLLVRGVTPGMYYGAGGSARENNSFLGQSPVPTRSLGLEPSPGVAGVGLKDLFTPVSTGRININTASSAVLQLLPGIDYNLATSIVQLRAGYDGVDGTEDDIPFSNTGELINVPGMIPQFVQQISQLCDVNSATFEVKVTARVSQYEREFHALLHRSNANNVKILTFSWE